MDFRSIKYEMVLIRIILDYLISVTSVLTMTSILRIIRSSFGLDKGNVAARSLVGGGIVAYGEDYTLGWNIELTNAQALWEAAAVHLLTSFKATNLDIEETLGSQDDPNVIDCLITLLPTVSIPGCEAVSILCHNTATSDEITGLSSPLFRM